MVLARSVTGLTVEVGDQFTDSRRGESLHAIFFLVSPEENPGQHLRLLAGVAGRADDDAFMESWLAVEDPADFRQVLLQEERFMTLHLSDQGPSSSLLGRELKSVEWPEGTLVALVRRGDEVLIPSGALVFEADDRLSIVGESDGIQTVRNRYTRVVEVEIPDFISGETDL
jgi:hypothetical protein